MYTRMNILKMNNAHVSTENITNNAAIIKLRYPIHLEMYPQFSLSLDTDIGGRKTQEDRYLAVPSIHADGHDVAFFGVFDGTVGDFASSNIENIMMRHLTTLSEWKLLLKGLGTNHDRAEIIKLATNLMKSLYKNSDNDLIELCKRNSIDYSSSTSVTALFIDKYIIIAHLGDSRAAICYRNDDKYSSRFVTVDHKPNNPDERRRIQASGGSVEFLCSHSNNPFIRGGDFITRRTKGEQPMQLQYSRAFGGKDLKMYGLSNEPDVTVIERLEGYVCLVLASDGLWDVKGCDNVFKILLCGRELGKSPARYLIDSVLLHQKIRSKSADNITVIAIFLDNHSWEFL